MNLRSNWFDALVILLVMIAALYLAQLVWTFLSGFADIILLFALGWLISFMLGPMINSVDNKPLPRPLVRAGRSVFGAKLGARIENALVSRAAAVVGVYVTLAVIFVILITVLIRPVAEEVASLIIQSPQLVQRVPELAGAAERSLAQFGVNLRVQDMIQPVLGSVQGLATPLLQNMLAIAGGLLNVIGNLLFVMVIGFFFALDGPKITAWLERFIPIEYVDEFEYFTRSVDHKFGGFIRAQLFQGLVMGGGAALAMVLLGVDFSLVAGIFSGLLMLIPLIGPFLTFLPPIIVAILTGSPYTLVLFVVLVGLQFVLLNIMLPKVMADALGIHPLVVFVSLLSGIKVAGFWGALFALPVTGVIVAMVEYTYERRIQRISLPAHDHPALAEKADHTAEGENR